MDIAQQIPVLGRATTPLNWRGCKNHLRNLPVRGQTQNSNWGYFSSQQRRDFGSQVMQVSSLKLYNKILCCSTGIVLSTFLEPPLKNFSHAAGVRWRLPCLGNFSCPGSPFLWLMSFFLNGTTCSKTWRDMHLRKMTQSLLAETSFLLFTCMQLWIIRAQSQMVFLGFASRLLILVWFPSGFLQRYTFSLWHRAQLETRMVTCDVSMIALILSGRACTNRVHASWLPPQHVGTQNIEQLQQFRRLAIVSHPSQVQPINWFKRQGWVAMTIPQHHLHGDWLDSCCFLALDGKGCHACTFLFDSPKGELITRTEFSLCWAHSKSGKCTYIHTFVEITSIWGCLLILMRKSRSNDVCWGINCCMLPMGRA